MIFASITDAIKEMKLVFLAEFMIFTTSCVIWFSVLVFCAREEDLIFSPKTLKVLTGDACRLDDALDMLALSPWDIVTIGRLRGGGFKIPEDGNGNY
jgi:hypothetical protein